MDENEIILLGGKNTGEPVCELVPETPLPDLSETTRYTDEYLAFLASLENLKRNAEAVEEDTETVEDSTETVEDSTESVEDAAETAEEFENSDNE